MDEMNYSQNISVGNTGSDFSFYYSAENAGRNHKKKNKKLFVIILSVILSVLIVISSVFVVSWIKNKDVLAFEHANYNCFTEGFTDVLVFDEKTALDAVESVSDILGIKDVQKELEVVSVNTVDGDSFYRMQQYYNGIPLYGKTITLGAYEDGTAAALTSNFTPVYKDIPTEASKTLYEAQESIKSYFQNDNVEFNNSENNMVLFETKADEKGQSEVVLAYVIDVVNYGSMIVNADTAEVLHFNSYLNSAESAEIISKDKKLKSIGWRNDDGSYHLYNEEYNIEIFDLNGMDSDTDPNDDKHTVHEDFRDYGVDTMFSKNNKFDNNAVALLKGLVNMSEYYQDLAGERRLSCFQGAINNGGDVNNAFGGAAEIDGELRGQVLFGSNRVISSDMQTIGHEYTHCIFRSFIPDYTSDDMDAINEGIADIFGELVEYRFSDGKLSAPDWVNNDRNMINPREKERPATIRDLYTASTEPYTYSNGETITLYYFQDNEAKTDYSHFASNIISRAAYLMWCGIDNTEDRKIDETKLAKLWYKSIQFLNADSDFSQCRNAVELSAMSMKCKGELTDEQYRTVCTAFDQVGIVFSYTTVVKNEFDLFVENIDKDKTGDNKIFYNYRIVKMATEESGPELITEVSDVTGRSSLKLEDGSYWIRVTDASKGNSSQPIDVKIVVDGDSKDATDEVVVKTDFSSVMVVVLDEDDDDISDAEKFVDGSDMVVVDSKIIGAKDDGVYYKESVTSKEKKIASGEKIVSLLTDGKIVYYVSYESTIGGTETTTLPHTIYSVNIDGSEHKSLYTLNSGIQLLTFQNGCVYWLEQFNYGDGKLHKLNVSTKEDTDLGGEVIKGKKMEAVNFMGRVGNKLYFLNTNITSSGKNKDVVMSYDLSTGTSAIEVNNIRINFRNRMFEGFIYFEGYAEAGSGYSTDYYVYTINSNNVLSKSCKLSKDMDLQIVDKDCEYGLFFSDLGSDTDTMFDLYRVDLKTGNITTSKGETGRYKNKNYGVTYDLANPEDIYFLFNIGVYDESTNKIINKKYDKFEIDITKPMWIIDGYVVDWNLNTYKIYDEVVDYSNPNANTNSSTTSKTISEEEAARLALNKMGNGGEGLQAICDKIVQYNGENYYLFNIKWRVDDGGGKFHYSHVHYVVVSMDGSDVRDADYDYNNAQLYVY